MKLNRLVALVVALCLMLGCTAIAEQFPLVDEPTTLHIMAQVGSYYPDQKLDNVHGLQKYEEMSGVHIEWDNVSNSVFGDTLAARIADSGTKLPDIILRGKIGNDKLASWGEQGIIVDLRPYLEENAPNFWKLFNEESTISGAIVGANGEIWGLPQVILGAEMRTPTKLWLNKNAMEAIGMDDPKTLDDYVKVMTAIRDSDWNGNGENDEITTIASANNMHNYFYGSFGLRTRGAHHDVVDVDPETGELRVYFQHENFRKYVEFMTMMYQEKLIYQEIFTEGDKQSDVFNQTNRLSMLLNTIAPGDGWTFLSDDEMATLYGISSDLFTEDAAAKLENSSIVYDMYCHNDEGSSISVNFENINLFAGLILDEKSYLEFSSGNISEQFDETSGIRIVKNEMGEIEINGKTVPCLYVTLRYEEQGIDIYEALAAQKRGSFFGVVTISTLSENSLAETAKKITLEE